MQTGRGSEERAARELEARGYRILSRNFRCAAGEIDLVAVDGDALVFVEVRGRRDAAHGSALEAVGAAKRRQVTRVAEIYLARKQPRFRSMRFDVVAITGGVLEVVRDAWRLGELR
jgi:putative endonuclease